MRMRVMLSRDCSSNLAQGQAQGRKTPGRGSILNDNWRACLIDAVEAGPMPVAQDAECRWPADLVHWKWDELSVSVTLDASGLVLRAMGYRKPSALRRHCGQNGEVIALSKRFDASLAQIRNGLSGRSP